MTTIITKNGSGAPTAGQLSEGELAVDLTNKELYTKSGSTVIKIGSQGGSTGTFTDLTATSSFTSPGIDDNATSTAITIDASENVGIGGSPVSGSRKFMVKDTGDVRVDVRSGSDADLGAIDFSDASNTARGQIVYDHADDSMAIKTLSTERMRIDAAGLVGLGTDTPLTALHITQANDPVITLEDTGFGASATLKGSNGNMRIGSTTATIFDMAGTEKMRLDSSGNLGINQSSPAVKLQVKTATATNETAIRLSDDVTQTLNLSIDGTATTGGIHYENPNAGYQRWTTSSIERMRIDASGNLGIGTTLPSEALEVGSGSISINRSGAASPDSHEIKFKVDGSEHASINVENSYNMRFLTNGTERMRIDGSGNVGIGTSTPAGKQHTALATSHGWGAAWGAGTAVFGGAGSTSGAFGISYNDTDGAVLGAVAPGVAWKPVALYGSAFIFSVSGTEDARIDTSGNLLVGKTASTVAQPGFEARNTADVFSSINNSQNTYHVYDTTAQGFTFYVSATGTINAVNTTISALSDERLKENVRDLEDGLSKVMALQPRKFDWKAGKGRDIADDRGFIAQEFETVFPDMVNNDGLNLDENGESYKTVCANLIPTLVKSIQEQQAMIEELKTEVAALKGA